MNFQFSTNLRVNQYVKERLILLGFQNPVGLLNLNKAYRVFETQQEKSPAHPFRIPCAQCRYHGKDARRLVLDDHCGPGFLSVAGYEPQAARWVVAVDSQVVAPRFHHAAGGEAFIYRAAHTVLHFLYLRQGNGLVGFY